MTDRKFMIESLIRDLREGWAIKKFKALDKLGKMQAVEAIPTIISVLKNAKVSDVKRKAAETLGKIGSKDALRGLLESSLMKTEAGEVRRASIKAVGELGSIDSVPALLDIKRNGAMLDRVTAAQALKNVATKLGLKNVSALEYAYFEKTEKDKLGSSESQTDSEPEKVPVVEKKKFVCPFCKVKSLDDSMINCPNCNAPIVDD